VYIHLGSETTVSDNSIIGIFDIENTSVSRHTREFLAAAGKNNSTVYVSYEMPKAYVLCSDKTEGDKIYITQVSPLTLKKRAENVFNNI
jgi:hypothetical protein